MTRILIDALSTGYGGAETYLRECLPRLARFPVELHLLVSPRYARSLAPILPAAVRLHAASPVTANPILRHAYQRFVLSKRVAELRPDVLFVPGGLTGLRPTAGCRFRTVAMVQNMLPFEPRERRRYRAREYPRMRLRLWLLARKMRATLRRADRVIFISNHSANVVRPLIGPVDSRVIPHGAPEAADNGDSGVDSAGEAIRAKYGLGGRYLLYVSLFDPYKHQDRVIEGFERFMSNGAPRATRGGALRRPARLSNDVLRPRELCRRSNARVHPRGETASGGARCSLTLSHYYPSPCE
jgi:glycosyltransferase involved in cell wall biosynthesis